MYQGSGFPEEPVFDNQVSLSVCNVNWFNEGVTCLKHPNFHYCNWTLYLQPWNYFCPCLAWRTNPYCNYLRTYWQSFCGEIKWTGVKMQVFLISKQLSQNILSDFAQVWQYRRTNLNKKEGTQSRSDQVFRSFSKSINTFTKLNFLMGLCGTLKWLLF